MAGRDRLPRHEGGKDSSWYSESGSRSLTRFCRGEICPGFDALAILHGGLGSWLTLGASGGRRGGNGD